MSSGVNYLDKTTQISVFHDLWMVRTMLMSKRMRPTMSNTEFYQFQV